MNGLARVAHTGGDTRHRDHHRLLYLGTIVRPCPPQKLCLEQIERRGVDIA